MKKNSKNILLLILLLLTSLTACKEPKDEFVLTLERQIKNVYISNYTLITSVDGYELYYIESNLNTCETLNEYVYYDLVFTSINACDDSFISFGYIMFKDGEFITIENAISKNIISELWLTDYVDVSYSTDLTGLLDFPTDVSISDERYIVYLYQESSKYHTSMAKYVKEMCEIVEWNCYGRVVDESPVGGQSEGGFYRDHIPGIGIYIDGDFYNQYYGKEIYNLYVEITNTSLSDALEESTFLRYGLINGYDIISNPKGPAKFLGANFEYEGYIINYSVTFGTFEGFESIGIYAMKDGIEYTIESLVKSGEITMYQLARLFPLFEALQD